MHQCGCQVVPSLSLGLHLDPNEFRTAVKWWLEVNPSVSLDGNPMVNNSKTNIGLLEHHYLPYHCLHSSCAGFR